MTKKLLPLLITFIGVQNINCFIGFTQEQVLLGLNETKQVDIIVTNVNQSDTLLLFDVEQNGILSVSPYKILLQFKNNSYNVTLEGIGLGHSDVAVISNSSIDIITAHLAVNVYKSKLVDILSQIAGWIFIISWGSSYYPQMYINYTKKSVIGLNFDYLALNIVGYLSYGIFVVSLFFNSDIQMEYKKRYPRGLIPVKLNDVVYNHHGTMALLILIMQCCIYEKGTQKISTTAKSLLFLIAVFYIACITLKKLNFLSWLDFLYFCSYVKLVIALLKYIPQAYMNYQRKSTNGWSIGLVFLDLNGGIFSLTQMTLDAYNYNDWVSIFGNPTKFVLGILSLVFHSLFLVQHYVLYRHRSYIRIP